MAEASHRITETAKRFLDGRTLHFDQDAVVESLAWLGEAAEDHPDSPIDIVFTRNLPDNVCGLAFPPSKRNSKRSVQIALGFSTNFWSSLWNELTLDNKPFLRRLPDVEINDSVAHELVHAVDFMNPLVVADQEKFRSWGQARRRTVTNIRSVLRSDIGRVDPYLDSPYEKRAYGYTEYLDSEDAIPQIVTITEE